MPSSLLNAESTHPRPWYPPTEMETLLRVNDLDRIHKVLPRELRPRHNFLVDTPFGERLWFGARKGFAAGVILTGVEVTCLSKLTTSKAIFQRGVYHCLPLMGVTTSFVCGREALANLYERNGWDREATSTYALAPLASASVMGVWVGSKAFVWTAILGSLAASLYKEATVAGLWLAGDEGRRGIHHFFPDVDHKVMGFVKKYNKEPSYAKYVDETGKPLP